MFKIMLLVATVDLIDLQLRLVTNVTLGKASDYYGDHNFPLSLSTCMILIHI